MKINSSNITSLDLLPSFSSSASFSSLSHSLTFGDNYNQRSAKSINSLKMTLRLNFNEITDQEALDLISFLQSKLEYEVQNYNEAGYFDNKRVESFDYHPFYPYKQNKFICLAFNHDKIHYNCNNISANFEAIAPSILNSIESDVDHNPNIDAKIDLGNPNSSVSDNNVSLPAGSILYDSGNYFVGITNNDFNVDAGSSDNLSFSTDGDLMGNTISCNQTPLRNSIYIDNPNDCFYYPYAPITSDGNLDVKMFDFRPTKTSSLSYSPKYKQSTVTDYYVKYNKYGLNEDFLTLSLNFDARSDLEAKRILLFLESHLGYKKFGFHFQKDYSEKIHYFYCPEWEHTFVYRDNHSIQAKFIECSSA